MATASADTAAAPPAPALDLFSAQASAYAAHRPRYPAALFAYVASLCGDRRARAWDAGTGSGQAAVALAEYVDAVVATDVSAEQLAHATAHPRVTYEKRPAEASGLGAGTVDVVTAATAFHWFDRTAFLGEAVRVLRPNGVLALWAYDAVMDADGAPGVASVVQHLYADVLRGCWTEQRTPISAYGAVDLAPFHDVSDVPTFRLLAEWTLPQLLGYLGSWSAVQTYARQNGGKSALDAVRPQLEAAWGADPSRARTLSWQLSVRVARAPA